ncbi:MAG: hypothetical protein FWE19_00330 [Oscillospiraceae bacterium]|nr:hypothetical protein [Oscillospiraceae bacterium]
MSMAMTRTIENGIRGYHSDYTDRVEKIKGDLTEEDYKLEEGKVNYPTMAVMAYQSAALYDKRWQAACEVIDIIAEKVDVDADALGLNLYAADWNHKTQTASSPLADKIDQWLDKGGDKVKLKKRIAELEAENNVLRSLARKAV